VPSSHAASSSGPASTTGIRSWTGAQTSLARVVRIVAEAMKSSPIFVQPKSPANANSSSPSTV